MKCVVWSCKDKTQKLAPMVGGFIRQAPYCEKHGTEYPYGFCVKCQKAWARPGFPCVACGGPYWFPNTGNEAHFIADVLIGMAAEDTERQYCAAPVDKGTCCLDLGHPGECLSVEEQCTICPSRRRKFARVCTRHLTTPTSLCAVHRCPFTPDPNKTLCPMHNSQVPLKDIHLFFLNLSGEGECVKCKGLITAADTGVRSYTRQVGTAMHSGLIHFACDS